MLSRRSFLVSAGAGMAAGAMMGRDAFASHHERIPIGIQLYTVRSEADKDLEGTLEKLYAAGFREIEFAGYYGRNAADLGKLMKGMGFSLVSAHVGAADIAKNGAQIIADAKTLGLKFIVCSSPGVGAEKDKLPWEERMQAVDFGDWKWNAELFNKYGKQVADAGMTFGYHNHTAEFRKFGGKTAFDHLYEMTDPKYTKIQLDVGWATVAGVDPIAILEKYPGRVVSLHVKDVGKRAADGKEPPSVAIGEGVTDWKKVIGKARAAGVEHYFYEQDQSLTRPILESAKISADYLSKLTV
jgi:sugar phosphate isomerase/epimerase